MKNMLELPPLFQSSPVAVSTPRGRTVREQFQNTVREQFENSSRIPMFQSRGPRGRGGQRVRVQFEFSFGPIFFERGRGVQVQFEFAFVSQIKKQLKEQMRKAWMAKYDGKGAREGGSSSSVPIHPEIQRFPAGGRGRGSSSLLVLVYSDFIWGECQRWGAKRPAKIDDPLAVLGARQRRRVERPANSVCNRRPSRCFTGAWQRWRVERPANSVCNRRPSRCFIGA